jgi:iron complex outermembrane receptor protein
MKTRSIALLWGCSLAAIMLTATAKAQAAGGTSAPPPSAAPVAPDGAQGLEEIVVTANKREQNLNKVGLTVSALGGTALREQRISNVADLAQAIPGLTFAPTPNATPVYTLRGVGFFESTLAAYPDVSLYLDQTPLSLPLMAALTAFDLERVEVLKGPQGTLFGNNATGGAINFIAAKPTNELDAGVDLTYGSYGRLEESGFVSGPITDDLKGRFAFKRVTADEWQHSYTRDDHLGKLDNVAGRLLLDWQPTDDLKFELNLNAWRDQDDPEAPQKIANSPQNLPGSVGLGGTVTSNLPILHYPNAPSDPGAADWGPNRPFQDNNFKQFALRTDYDIADDLALTSLTSYDDLKFKNRTEGDGTALADLDLISDTAHITSVNQELRLSNGAGSAFRWVVGGNYEYTRVDENTGLSYANSTSRYLNGISVSAYYSHQRMTNFAGFGNAEYDLTDEVTLKAGIRETHARRTDAAATLDEPQFPSVGKYNLTEFFNTVYGAVYGGAVPTIGPFQPIELNQSTLVAEEYRAALSEHNTSFSAGVDYKPMDGLLLYLNIAKGYKAGSFPHVSGAIFTAYEPVTQESLMDYEGGFKAQFLDRKLSVNGAGFHYDYQDKQLRAKFIDPIFGSLDRLVNVPQSEVTGGEIEVNARPVLGLTLSAAATYLNAEVTSYNGVIGSTLLSNGLRQAVTSSFSGVSLPFAPEWQYVLRADYDFPLTDTFTGFAGVGVNGQSESIGILTVSPTDRSLYRINGRALVNFDIGVRTSDDRWRLTVWGQNIFNQYYWTNTIQSYDTVVRYAGRPAEFGVTIGFRM